MTGVKKPKADPGWKDVADRPPPLSICPRCRTNPKAVNISTRVTRTVGQRPVKAITSKSITYCEPCALEVFADMLETMEETQ